MHQPYAWLLIIFFFRACSIEIDFTFEFFCCSSEDQKGNSSFFISSYFSQLFFVFGSTNIWPSACVNSLPLKTFCLGEISFLYALPIWKTPSGNFFLK